MQRLNTNSRFIYEGIATYAERIVATLPAPLEVVFFVCTGSEANDLALRISRQVTGREDVVVLDGAYHGNTAAVMGVSPNRYKGRGGRGAPPTTHEVMTPDVYRGPYGRDDPDAGAKYGAHAARLIEGLVEQGRAPAAFIAESLMGTAGNIVFPTGFLHTAFAAARAAGTICIADEVQIGVGRLGTHFWGFQAQGVVPDIVTMGKPLGNGHPIAAVVTTREIADAFDDGVKYFNTFAGSPVSCAIGNAVMDIVQGDELQANALDVGSYLLDLLLGLKSQHELIGDVRGHGLYLGGEFVRNRETKEPAAAEAMSISERLKDHGIITYPNGIYDNVLKIKPPMIFNREHADLFTEVLGDILHRFPRG
jgi:4-aminobutyrate aminotransferase-like enzyme